MDSLPLVVARVISDRMPHNTQRIIEALGWDDALLFLARQKMGESYVPPHYEKDHPLWHGLSEAQAKALAKLYGGGNVKWPSADKMLSAERYALILKDSQRKLDLGSIASKYNLTKQEVIRVVQRFGIKQN